jgi:hypothetical protein
MHDVVGMAEGNTLGQHLQVTLDLCWVQWLTPAFLVSWKAKIRRIAESAPAQKSKAFCQKYPPQKGADGVTQGRMACLATVRP